MTPPDLFLDSGAPLEGLTEPTEVPLTLNNGGPVIGTAVLHPDGTVTGHVTDPGVRERLMRGVTSGFSASLSGVVVHETREGG